MATSLATRLTCVVLLCMAGALIAQATISCSKVVSYLAPCLNYLRGNGTLTSKCCSGVKSLKKAAKTTSDRQQACKCLKSAYKSISGIKASRASGLAKKCGVNVQYKISSSYNCSSVK